MNIGKPLPTSPSLARGQASVYPSLVRPVHVAGVERKAAGLLTIINLTLLFTFPPNWITPGLVVFTLLLVLPALRRATKRDPQILEVYRSHVLRAGIYQGQPPHSHPHLRHARTL